MKLQWITFLLLWFFSASVSAAEPKRILSTAHSDDTATEVLLTKFIIEYFSNNKDILVESGSADILLNFSITPLQEKKSGEWTTSGFALATLVRKPGKKGTEITQFRSSYLPAKSFRKHMTDELIQCLTGN